MTELDIPSMHDIFEQYRELSQSLHEEARIALMGPIVFADVDIAARLERQAVELDRVIAQYELRRSGWHAQAGL